MEFSHTLKKNYEFRRLYAKGKSAVSPRVVLYCRKNGTDKNRLGITVSAKLGNAVCRNKIRRRFREIYRTNEGALLPGYDIVMAARMRSVESAYHELESDFLRLAEKLGIKN